MIMTSHGLTECHSANWKHFAIPFHVKYVLEAVVSLLVIDAYHLAYGLRLTFSAP